MQEFTNKTIDVSRLPRYETVEMNKLHPKYWNVILINTIIIFSIIGIATLLAVFFIDELDGKEWIIALIYLFLLCLVVFLSKIGFKKKGFAFREHDVIFRNGIIATNTMVIPYNRVQHVALHEGFISRFFGLAKVEIFTAGGDSSDIEIPGIEKEQAENIKQLLMGKLQKQL